MAGQTYMIQWFIELINTDWEEVARMQTNIISQIVHLSNAKS